VERGAVAELPCTLGQQPGLAEVPPLGAVEESVEPRAVKKLVDLVDLGLRGFGEELSIQIRATRKANAIKAFPPG
jgi:hypothetical protein